MKPAKPLWGFGWVGWCLLPVALGLAWAYFSGRDLRFALLDFINNTWGIQAVYWTVLHPIFFNWAVVDLPGFGWWGLLWALVALQIHPRRGTWYERIALVVWILVRTELFMWFLRAPGAGPAAWIMSMTGGWLDATGAAIVVCGAMDVLVLTASRSLWVAAGLGAAVVLGTLFYKTPTQVTGPELSAYIYHAIAGGSMILWAVLALRKQFPPGCCTSCGYDLRGLGSDRCPECGSVAAVSPPSGLQPAGVNSPP